MPQKELERLAAVNRFLNLEFSKEKELQQIVELAARICKTPTALITLIAEDTQHVRFKVGFEQDTTRREDAFCNHVIQKKEMMMVPDALLDDRFVNNPLVTGDPGIRFYAGSPITTQDGHNLGSLCVIGQETGELSSDQQEMLQALSKQVIHLLEFDASLNILKEQFLAAKDAEIKLRSYFESSSACHLLLGKDLEVLVFNKATSRFIKQAYQAELAIGMKMSDYIHPEHVPAFITNCNDALNGISFQAEKQFTYGTQSIWWSLTFAPARNPDGEIIGVSYDATDITERMQHGQKVLAQNESLKKIAYIQSHEMRRPVASILGLMSLFKEANYVYEKEDMLMLERATQELDEKIKSINSYTE
ncbi:MAG: GAF domain-containing protein [Sphingobacteriaceae bacterium]|nr:MAG: GAF domain-containing protein [Sphingobacteriaceae bacterium]